MTALGYARAQLQFHIKAALNVGCSRQQVIEAIIQVSSYTGFPATLDALYAAKEVLDTVAEQRDGEAGDAEQDLVDIEDRYERGLAFMERIDGAAGKRVVETLQDIAPDLARYIIEYTFGEIYPRLHLSLKHREIVTVAACTALGTALPELKVHTCTGS